MGTSRALARAAKQRKRRERRAESRPERRAAPALREQRRLDVLELAKTRTALIATMTDEERAILKEKERRDLDRLMGICGPVVALAAASAFG